jgi:hypothetical protein
MPEALGVFDTGENTSGLFGMQNPCATLTVQLVQPIGQTSDGRQFEVQSMLPHSEKSPKNCASFCPAFGDEARRHQLFLMSVSKAKPPFGSRVALNATRGDT